MKLLSIIFITLLFTSTIFSQSVIIKDNEATPNTLLEITDEGTTGSIYLPSGGAPTPFTDKLYNEGGTLKWDGKNLATGNSLWTLSTVDIYRSDGNVGIGITNPASKLSVGGAGFSNTTIYSDNGDVGGKAIYGRAGLEAGFGVYGLALNSGNTTNYGGYFQANGITGKGVYGYANNSLGAATNYGGHFIAKGGQGIGVKGIAEYSDGSYENYGGYFEANGRYGRGVYGLANGQYGRGVLGKTTSNTGYAVRGEATNTGSGIHYGGYFIADGANGVGVYGSGSKYGGYFDGKGYFLNSVGIGELDPSEELHITGTRPQIRLEKTETTDNFGIQFFENATFRGSIGYSLDNDYIFLYEDGNIIVKNGALGIGLTTIATGRALDVNGGAYCTGTTWVNASDKNLKENFKLINGDEILKKVADLNITSWNYKTDENETTHIGPVSQEFYKLFDVGNDDKSISTIDADGISLAAIQALYRKNMELENQNEILISTMEILKDKITQIEQSMTN